VGFIKIYTMNWLLQGKEITDVQQFGLGATGFVYKITNKETGKFYIGKKILENKTKKLLTKKEQSEWDKPGRIPKKKLVVKESNWADYYGSSKPLLEDLKSGKEKFTREILRVCFSKKELSYYEVFYQFEYKVLHVDSYNENVMGKFYRKDTLGAQESI
jgi:hypothetical protein